MVKHLMVKFEVLILFRIGYEYPTAHQQRTRYPEENQWFRFNLDFLPFRSNGLIYLSTCPSQTNPLTYETSKLCDESKRDREQIQRACTAR
ncbi:unnamed protein product [Cochlearia groenlandica]